MSVVKVTRKRQVTLPKEVCERLGIVPGDYVRIYIDDHGKVVIEKVIGVDDLEGVLNPGYQLRNLAEDLDRERKYGER